MKVRPMWRNISHIRRETLFQFGCALNDRTRRSSVMIYFVDSFAMTLNAIICGYSRYLTWTLMEGPDYMDILDGG